MEQLLTTKLFIPYTRPELISRPRLIEQLNGGLHSKLTLISAPAGFGKTTLAIEWLGNLRGDAKKETQTENRIAWLSLDESDNDYSRFLNYFVAALNRAVGEETAIGKGISSMLQAAQPPSIEATLTPLINEITAVPYRIILIPPD